MRKLARNLLRMLCCLVLLAVLTPPAASAASADYTIDKVSYTADLRSDGSALITEEWTLTFGADGADGFERHIDVDEDPFEWISGIRNLSVSVDGNLCSEESSDTLRRGAYSLTQSDEGYRICWYCPSQNETHVFVLRYVLSDAVKLYHEEAYFYFRITGENSTLLCKNVSAVVRTPSPCFSEDMTILTAGSLAGEKSEGAVSFSAVNTAGFIHAGVKLPASLFDTGMLTLITDDRAAVKTGGISGGAVLLALLAVFAVLMLRYRKLFRWYWEKRCRRKAHEESSYPAQEKILDEISPAQVLLMVLEQPKNRADYFIVTALELIKRGYITVTAGGFCVSEASETDFSPRGLKENEKRLLTVFASDSFAKMLDEPQLFYEEAERFRKTIKFLSPRQAVTKKGRTLAARCFEMRLASKYYERISSSEISDDFCRNGRYTVPDLLIAVLQDADSLGETNERDSYPYDLFKLRTVYNEGKKQQQKAMAETAEHKKKKR